MSTHNIFFMEIQKNYLDTTAYVELWSVEIYVDDVQQILLYKKLCWTLLTVAHQSVKSRVLTKQLMRC